MLAPLAPCVPLRASMLDVAFEFGAEGLPGRGLLFVLLALGIHGALSLVAGAAPPPARASENVTIVELAPPVPEHLPEPMKTPERTGVPRAAAPPNAPQAARAGALLTAKETAPSAKQDELVDFVTDPAGASYGSGVVARGGSADHGEHGATAREVRSGLVQTAAQAGGEPLTAVSNLSRRAALAAQNPCVGFYPSEASVDSGAVTLTLVVRADGRVASALVVSETPAGEGFGKAARACLERQRFEPSLDRAGLAVTAPATIKLRFTR